MVLLTRVLPPAACLSVAALSFRVSFSALAEVSADVGAVSADLAWAIPLIVDGALVASSAVVWAAGLFGRRDVPAILATAAFVVLSVVLNVAHAAPNPLARLIAAMPPVALLVTLELAVRALRYSGPAGQDVASGAVDQELAHVAQVPAGSAQAGSDTGEADDDAQPQAAQDGDTDSVWADLVAHVARVGPPRPSQRAIAAELGIPRSTLQRVIAARRNEWDRLGQPATNGRGA